MIIYSTILLIRLVWADRCQIIKYHTLSDGTYTDLSFIRVILCSYSNTWAVNLIRAVFHLDVSSCWSRVIKAFCVLWSFRTCRHWWSRGQGLKELPHWWTYRYSWRPLWTCLSDLRVSLTQLFFNGKKQNFRSWDYSPQVADFLIDRRRIKGILLYILRFKKYLNFAPEIYLALLEINIFKKLTICKALCTKDHSPFPVEGINAIITISTYFHIFAISLAQNTTYILECFEELFRWSKSTAAESINVTYQVPLVSWKLCEILG